MHALNLLILLLIFRAHAESTCSAHALFKTKCSICTLRAHSICVFFSFGFDAICM
nr:MAG TPA: hypothetical protein [Caudoviricetes sp.]